MSDQSSGEILIVGGDDNLRAMQPTLSQAGLAVRNEANVYEGLVSFEKRPSDWILLDLDGLQEEDLEFISTVRRLSPQTPVLLSFPLSCREFAATGLERGAHGYLLRPFYPGELLSLLRRTKEMSIAPVPFAALEALAGGVSHEINNPLTIVMGWVQMLLRESEEGSRQRRPLEMMKRECERIASVVQDLQIVATTRALERQPAQLAQIVLDTIEDMRAAGELAHLRVDLRSTKSLPSVDVDVVQFKKAIRELMRNAVQATTAPHGRLTVEILPQGDEQSVRFQDNGRGIRPENLGQIFLPFFSEGSKDRKRGIGLAVARGVVESHGGRLDVRSVVREGTTFELTLPLLGQPRRAPLEAPSRVPGLPTATRPSVDPTPDPKNEPESPPTTNSSPKDGSTTS